VVYSERSLTRQGHSEFAGNEPQPMGRESHRLSQGAAASHRDTVQIHMIEQAVLHTGFQKQNSPGVPYPTGSNTSVRTVSFRQTATLTFCTETDQRLYLSRSHPLSDTVTGFRRRLLRHRLVAPSMWFSSTSLAKPNTASLYGGTICQSKITLAAKGPIASKSKFLSSASDCSRDASRHLAQKRAHDRFGARTEFFSQVQRGQRDKIRINIVGRASRKIYVSFESRLFSKPLLSRHGRKPASARCTITPIIIRGIFKSPRFLLAVHPATSSQIEHRGHVFCGIGRRIPIGLPNAFVIEVLAGVRPILRSSSESSRLPSPFGHKSTRRIPPH